MESQKKTTMDRSEFIVVCTECRKTRDDRGGWKTPESPERGPGGTISHGICPPCARKLYPEYFPAAGNETV